MFNYLKLKALIVELQHRKKPVRIQDMADHMDVSKKMLELYREGKSNPTADVLERMAIYFEKDMNYFFDSFDQIKSNIVSTPPAEYHKPEDNYKALYEMQKEINEIIKDNADLRVENERLKNVTAPTNGAKTG